MMRDGAPTPGGLAHAPMAGLRTLSATVPTAGGVRLLVGRAD